MARKIPNSTTPAVLFILLIGASILLISLDLTQRARSLKTFIRYVFAPTPAAALQLLERGSELGENMERTVHMREENRALKEQLVRLSYLEGKYPLVMEENERLRQAAGFGRSSNYDLVPARVIAHDTVNFFRSFTIDKGAGDGMAPELPVIALQDGREALVGRIADAGPRASQVLLVTDEMSAVPARVLHIGENGVAQGRNEKDLLLDYLLSDSRVKIGDEVVTSGIGEVFPAGIFIGLVTEVKPVGRDLFRRAVVKSNMNITKLNEVYIIRKARE